ncbi:hypothetical protein [Pseudomonas vranovensis]|uniref:hypothetical protein n=1 Tax=Pseudomonas vranovensis TaxID=321661 RepID=UPI003D97833F
MIRANFTAELHTQFGQVGVTDREGDWGPGAVGSAIEDGWLCVEGGLPGPNSLLGFLSLRFHFQYVKEEPSRIFYSITGTERGAYAGSTLEKSKNGWLGMYGTHLVGRITHALNPANLLDISGRRLWKIETLQEWDGEIGSAESIECYLRDSLGHRVALVHSGKTYYFHAGNLDGEILKFRLRNIRLE